MTAFAFQMAAGPARHQKAHSTIIMVMLIGFCESEDCHYRLCRHFRLNAADDE